MRVFLSSGIEGCAGISDWDQVRIGEPEFALGRELLAAEVNAAIVGAVEGGAEPVLGSQWGAPATSDPRRSSCPLDRRPVSLAHQRLTAIFSGRPSTRTGSTAPSRLS
jgi:hypothetical protein